MSEGAELASVSGYIIEERQRQTDMSADEKWTALRYRLKESYKNDDERKSREHLGRLFHVSNEGVIERFK